MTVFGRNPLTGQRRKLANCFRLFMFPLCGLIL